MSIIDNLLVLFDDQKQRTIKDVKTAFPEYTKQVLSASLGRIASKGWINKKSDRYKISDIGRKIVTENLKNIDKITSTEKITNCLFVVFHIPEKERINRDIMRNFLITNGYGRLHNTVWINFRPDTKTLQDIINELKIQNKVLTFEIKIKNKKIKEIIDFTDWNSNKTDSKYKKFTNHVKYFLKLKNKPSIKARCLVYKFSKIVREDPLLPDEKTKKDSLNKAYNYYSKLRKFC